jgi:hypothetical protein
MSDLLFDECRRKHSTAADPVVGRFHFDNR